MYARHRQSQVAFSFSPPIFKIKFRHDHLSKISEQKVQHLEEGLAELTHVIGRMSTELAKSDTVKAAMSNNLVKVFNDRFRNFEDRILAVQKSAGSYQNGLSGKKDFFTFSSVFKK